MSRGRNLGETTSGQLCRNQLKSRGSRETILTSEVGARDLATLYYQ